MTETEERTDTALPDPATDPAGVMALETLQFAIGGLFDSRPVPGDDFAVHLVRSTRRGTPGPTLCGIDRFHKESPGWSVGGGVSGPDIRHIPCTDCTLVAVTQFPDLPISGLGKAEITAAVVTAAKAYAGSPA